MQTLEASPDDVCAPAHGLPTDDRARLDYAVRLSGIGFWYCDLPFDTLSWDARVKEHFWLAADAAVTIDTFYERMHPDDRASTRAAIDESIAQHAPYDVHYRTQDPAGAGTKWIRALGGAAYGADGAPIRFDGVTVDVTREKEQEARLNRVAVRHAFALALSDRLSALASPEAIANAAAELLGAHFAAARVTYAEIDEDQGKVRPRYGWTRPGEQVLTGQELTLEAFGPHLIRDLRAGHSVKNTDVSRDPRTAASKDAFHALGVQAELVVPLIQDGRLAVVLAVHADVPRAWSDEDLEIAQDVAARTWLAVDVAHAQADLRAERDLSRAILESMSEGFVLLERDWTIRYMNQIGVQLSQRPRDAVVGCNLWDVVPQLAGGALQRFYERVRETRQPGTLEMCSPDADGAERWFEVRAYPAVGLGLAAFYRDITARRHAERAAQDANRRKDEFLAMLAHELRNPLAPIRAAADLLSMGPPDAARIAQTSAIISRQVTHMTSLVDDLLDVSRVTRGLAELARAPVQVTDVVSAAVEQVRPLITARRHRLAVHLAPGLGAVLGDGKRLVQVLANVLTNAAKYTPDGGDITIRVDEQDDGFVLSVTDNGIGMSAELVDQAFELFAQAERTPDRAQGGLGIGLALARSLVELHGGGIAARSAGLGAGSEFTIRLPKLVRVEHPMEPRDDVRPLARLDHLTVLIVDDNEDAAHTLAMCLQALGCRCLVEHDPYKALARARASAPDACILDIGLPGMDGNALARQLRRDTATRDMLLIAVTGYGQEQDRRVAADAGFDHHEVKPPDLPRLVGLLGSTARAPGSRPPAASAEG